MLEDTEGATKKLKSRETDNMKKNQTKTQHHYSQTNKHK
jgi:hypothetical protein